jgi:hypothetical protein
LVKKSNSAGQLLGNIRYEKIPVKPEIKLAVNAHPKTRFFSWDNNLGYFYPLIADHLQQ